MMGFKHSITRKILWIIIFSSAAALFLLFFFYMERQKAYDFLMKHTDFYVKISEEYADVIQSQKTLLEEISLLDPEEEDRKALERLVSERNPYTEIKFTDSQTGESIVSFDAKAIDNSFAKLYFAGMDVFPDNKVTTRTLSFHDVTVSMEVRTYLFPHFIELYFLFCSILCILVILLPVLFFVRKKMFYIRQLCSDISSISLGNLDYPITVSGKDEIGLLAEHLDQMRMELSNSIRQEQSVHFRNRELISALSHDLRTPLTILNGYLEIIQHSGNLDSKNASYLKRSIRKIEELRNLSDKLFEYAVIYEDFDHPQMEPVSSFSLLDLIRQHMEFLGFEGFSFEIDNQISAQEDLNLFLNQQYLHRIFNNLFSNLQKYGDKSAPICITFSVYEGTWRVVLKNKIRNTQGVPESTKIGLKSTEKMVQRMHGSFCKNRSEDSFSVCITFPLLPKE